MTRLPAAAGAFLRTPETQRVLAVLGAAAGETRVVGGAVRNALIGQPVTEIDLATVLTPPQVVERAEAAGLKVALTGIDHGTVTVVCGGKPFEVTTLRADVETDGRRAVVRFTTDWREDASRRDLTINALYCDADGTVFDPLGGYEDILARRIRFIGDPEDRIREDYLRILRFFRFFAWYGDGRPDAEALKACARLKAGIATLSAERVWSELKRLLSAPDPSRALLWMRTTEVLQRALPESWGIDAVHRLIAAEKAERWLADPLLRLEAVLPPHRARIEALAARLRLSKTEAARLVAWAEAPTPPPNMPEVRLAQILYRAGALAVADRLMHELARDRESGDAAAVADRRRQLAFARSWTRPVFPWSGKDLVAAGVAPGPEIGRRLKALEERWIDSGFGEIGLDG